MVVLHGFLVAARIFATEKTTDRVIEMRKDQQQEDKPIQNDAPFGQVRKVADRVAGRVVHQAQDVHGQHERKTQKSIDHRHPLVGYVVGETVSDVLAVVGHLRDAEQFAHAGKQLSGEWMMMKENSHGELGFQQIII